MEQMDFFLGDWRVSPADGAISRGDEVVHLEPKVMEVLVYLASRPMEVVTRDDLERSVWCGALVGYDAVTGSVIKLRRALRDDARKPRYVATIPKRGYKLIAPVRTHRGAAPEAMPGPAPPAPDGAPPAPHKGHGRHLSWLAALVLGGLIVATARFWSPALFTSAPANVSAPVLPALIVLPFENLSHDPEQDYLADGMTEDLITDLSRTAKLRVLANNTSVAYKGTQVVPQEIGERLQVDFVLQGSIRPLERAIRVNAQLVDARTGFTQWAETYDRTTDEVFAVQHEITAGVVEALEVTLTDEQRQWLTRKATSNLEAYDHFQEGQRLSKLRTREANRQAQEAYRKAIEIDPTYGRAYGALAFTLGVDYRRGWTDTPVETLDRALELAKNAVALDASTPQTLWALGYVHLVRKEFDRAESAASQAIKIAPNYADGYALLALIRNNLGDPKQALELIRKGMRLNPNYSWDYQYTLGRAYYALGSYAKAIEALEEARNRNPSTMPLNLFLAASYVRQGRRGDAEWIVQELQAMNPPVTLALVQQSLPIANPKHMDKLVGDLRKAGMPE